MQVFEVTDGELIESLQMQADSAGISRAAILALIGAVDSFTVSTMPVHDAEQDVVTDYRMPGEVHGSGEIRDGKVHVHATFAVQGDRAIARHVHAGEVRTHFVRAYIAPTSTPSL